MSDPVTAPELVEVVAAVLDTHVRIKSQTLHQECLCGWVGGLLGYDHCAHQAAAVLAALTEAGTVEWGIFRKDEAGNTWTPMENARFKTLAKAESYRKNMFLPAFQEIIEPRFRHVGPWQKLEE